MKLWGGRFAKSTAPELEQLGKSIEFDKRLALEDIRVNRAYVRELNRVGIVDEEELALISKGLDSVEDRLRNELDLDDEDIHTAVERLLGEVVEHHVSGKLPTGRSRNDLTATDLRLYLASAIDKCVSLLHGLQKSLLAKAMEHVDVIMPGYTHLRRGQPVVFAQYLLAYFWALDRDRERLGETKVRTLGLALGCGALAGNPFGVNRRRLAEDLGFNHVLPNSIDGVSSRDYLIEYLSVGAMIGVNLSRIAEDLILWSGAEFGFIAIDESYSTGSSLMPQKRNPDSLELVRGKSGRLCGNLVSLLTTVKALPTGYQRDLQEDKEAVFDTIDTLILTIPVMEGVVNTFAVNRERMAAALSPDLLATDLAEYLVGKGLPFRDAHSIAGKVFAAAEERQVAPADFTLEELRAFCPEFDNSVNEIWDYTASLERRDVEGGVSRRALEEQIAKAKKRL